MSSLNNPAYVESNNRSWGRCRQNGSSRCGNWSGFNITAMILGFVLFWPLGLLILFSNMSGRDVRELPRGLRDMWSSAKASFNHNDRYGKSDHSENDVFDEYQQTQYDRIHEIKEEIKSRSQRFKEFRASLKRRANEEEFNRFMADKPSDADKDN